MAPAVRLEKFAEPHLPAVLAIEQASNSAPWSERSFRNEIGHPHGIFFVAKAGGDVVGFGGVWLLVDEAHVINVAVRPDSRRQGIARRIVTELMLAARDKGMVCATLEVRAGNEAAIRLYERLGFERSALRRRYYPDNKEDALVMWLHDLEGWAPPTS